MPDKVRTAADDATQDGEPVPIDLETLMDLRGRCVSGPEGAENASQQITALVACLTGRVIGSFTPVPAADRSSRTVVRVR